MIEEPGGLVADDGRALSSTWFRPGPGERVRGAVLVVSALAVHSRYYRTVARWLAGEGFLVLTFDIRGVESSAAARAETGDARRWIQDVADALDHLVGQKPDGVPVTWLGHSFGGQLVAFSKHEQLDAVLTMGSGWNYWPLLPARVRYGASLLYGMLMPGAAATLGWFPGRRLGVFGDLQGNAVRQFARWCRSPAYFGVDIPDFRERFAGVRVPVTSLEVTDDWFCGAAGARTLTAGYTNATVRHVVLRPADLGVTTIGHFGLFRPAFADAWPTHLAPFLASA